LHDFGRGPSNTKFIRKRCTFTSARDCLLRPEVKGIRGLYTDEGLERLEVILNVARELGAHLAGVETMLNMREKMERCRSRPRVFVETLKEELWQRAARRPFENNSLMPVIQIDSMSATRADAKRPPEGKRKAR
jgi:DNA-binding transcriptional MerR regulator